jgi:hypothetical protein
LARREVERVDRFDQRGDEQAGVAGDVLQIESFATLAAEPVAEGIFGGPSQLGIARIPHCRVLTGGDAHRETRGQQGCGRESKRVGKRMCNVPWHLAALLFSGRLLLRRLVE